MRLRAVELACVRDIFGDNWHDLIRKLDGASLIQLLNCLDTVWILFRVVSVPFRNNVRIFSTFRDYFKLASPKVILLIMVLPNKSNFSGASSTIKLARHLLVLDTL